MLAQDRDRFAREPAYHYLLKREFEEHSCKLQALNDHGDDSPEGELTDGILDQLAKYERAKIAERTRRGKIRKAREGRNLRSPQPPLSFRYGDIGDEVVIYEPEMLVVKKVFEMTAAGLGSIAIQSHLHCAGIATREGKLVWSHKVLQRIVKSDVYKPHTYDEVAELVTPQVAARLDPNKEYGIRWHNKYKITGRTVSEPDDRGERRYKKRTTTVLRPKDEWVAVPVPAYLPRSLVEQARAATASNKDFERKHLAREWELRGVIRCSCGYSMKTHTTKSNGRPYHYYGCARRRQLGKKCDCKQPSIREHQVETMIWDFVSGLLNDPERIRRGVDAMIAQQRAGMKGDPEREESLWVEKLAQVSLKRSRYQEMAAEGLITFGELKAKLTELQESREVTERELESLRSRKEHLKEVEKDRDAVLDSLARMVPASLKTLSGQERNKVYRMLRLLVTPVPEGYEVTGALCTTGPCSPL